MAVVPSRDAAAKICSTPAAYTVTIITVVVADVEGTPLTSVAKGVAAATAVTVVGLTPRAVAMAAATPAGSAPRVTTAVITTTAAGVGVGIGAALDAVELGLPDGGVVPPLAVGAVGAGLVTDVASFDGLVVDGSTVVVVVVVVVEVVCVYPHERTATSP